MRRCATAASLMLVFVAALSSAAERLSDPTRDFVEGYDPSQNDFFANTPERTVLLRIRMISMVTASPTSRCPKARRGAMPAANGCCSTARAPEATCIGARCSSARAPWRSGRSRVS